MAPGIPLFPQGLIPTVSASSVREFARPWTGHLARYRNHQNDEHLEALIAEALRYTGFHLENDLSVSPYWSKVPLARRAALLLFLVDRGVVIRSVAKGRPTYEAPDNAVLWATGQAALASFLVPTLEFIAALQSHRCRSARP